MLARTLADITDLDEASITAIVATLRSLWDDADNGSEQTLPLALERTLQAPLNGAYIHAMLAGAVLRSHETLTRMQEADSAATGFTPAQVEAQRRDAAMTIRAFCAWERATGFAPPAETGRQNGDGPWRSGENDGQS
ncbi:hypothetical protein [Knoellia aerolata]|uniref:hypothetical protein n=1 Tax=Knoellia aerolata TaxID=442954 RepID=UPI0012ED00AA|nr:hypothetical protein [Knoellia aerolata]